MTKRKLLDRIMVLEQRVDALEARLAVRVPQWSYGWSIPLSGPHTISTPEVDHRWTNIAAVQP